MKNLPTTQVTQVVFFLIIILVSVWSLYDAYYHKNNYFDGLESSEGQKETIAYLEENCTSAFSTAYLRFTISNYYPNITSNTSIKAECAIIGNYRDNMENDFFTYASKNNCNLNRTVEKNGLTLMFIYRCLV